MVIWIAIFIGMIGLRLGTVKLGASGLILFFLLVKTILGGPVWERPRMSLGSLSINGALEQRFYLGSLGGSPEFAFSIYLEHTLRDEVPVSEYQISQLESYVIPEGRDEVLWVQPGGVGTVFKRKEILKKEPTEIEEGWVAVERSPLSYDFLSADGWCYRYEQGGLKSLTSPTGRELFFETSGILISRIYQKTDAREVTLLEAKENELGQPEEITIGPVTHRFRYAGEEDLLAEWQSSIISFQPVTFLYDSNHLVSGVVFPGGDKLSYQWGDTSGEWQKEVDWKLPQEGDGYFLIKDNDFSYRYGISREGINLSRTDVTGVSDGFVFNPRTQRMVIRNRDGGEVARFYGVRGEEYGRLESVRDARGRESVSLTYDEKGRVETRKVPGAAPIRYEYDEQDRLTAIYRLEELNQKFEYEGESQKPSVITNALGKSTRISYNEAGQVTRYQSLDGAVYEYEYDDLGQLVVEKWPLGYQRSIERDEFNRIVKRVNLDGSETRYEFTKEGRLASTEQGGKKWDYQYDEMGLVTQLNRDGELWQKIEREKLAGVDGEVVKSVRGDGKTSIFEMDAKGNVKKETDALGNTTEYKHDELGQLAGWKDGRGVVAEFERDSFGRVSQVETEGAKPLQMAYDQTGRLTRRKTGEQDIQYRYNKEGQLRQIDYGKGETIDYEYDKYGRILVATTSQGVKTTYTWDKLDRKTSERNDIPGGVWTLVKWEYASGGRKAMVAVYQNGDDLEHRLQETRYQYDLLGRYSGILVNGEQKIWYDYEPKTRRLARKRFANGWTIDYGHHPNGRPASILAKDENGQTVKDVTYKWGDDGKLSSRILDGVLHEYEYDDLGRLTAVNKQEVGKKNENEGS